MHRHRGLTLIDTLVTLALLAIIALLVVPKYADASTSAGEAALLAQLQTLRKQIEVYNAEHRTSKNRGFWPFNRPPKGQRGSGRARGWDPELHWIQLIEAGLLTGNPKNPLQNGSYTVMRRPGPGTGWVWWDPDGDLIFTLYAVDRDGNLLDVDHDGIPD